MRPRRLLSLLAVFAGFRCTAWIGLQLRVGPLQHCGWRAFKKLRVRSGYKGFPINSNGHGLNCRPPEAARVNAMAELVFVCQT